MRACIQANQKHGAQSEPDRKLGGAALVATGPWLLTIAALAAISLMTVHSVGLEALASFRVIVIYAFCFSLVATAAINMIATRVVGDALHLGRLENVRNLYLVALFAGFACALAISVLVFGSMLHVPAEVFVVSTSMTIAAALIWIGVTFCSVLRDYTGIVQGFTIGLCVSMIGAVCSAWSGYGPLAMAVGMTAGLITAFLLFARRILHCMPASATSFAEGVRELRSGLTRFAPLVAGGVVGAAALWVDKWILWASPYAQLAVGGLYHAPIYDSAMFIAYLVIIPSLALFVSILEGEIRGHFDAYYRAISSHATLRQIEEHARVIRDNVLSGLTRIITIQAVLCAIVIMSAPAIVGLGGLHYEQIGILRIGVLGALFHFVFLACTTLLLYFERYAPYFVLQTTFAALMAAGTWITLMLDESFLGFGYLAAAAVSGMAAYAVLDRTLSNITYLTFIASASRSGKKPPRRRGGRWFSNATRGWRTGSGKVIGPGRRWSAPVPCLLVMSAVCVSAPKAAAEVTDGSPAAVPVAMKTAADGTVIERGDRLRIRIMQQLDTEPEPDRNRAPLKTYFDRTDLSDDYEVQGDGSVTVPRLGQIPAYGRTIADVRSSVAALFTEMMGRASDVSISIVDRAPIYVTGPLRSPGSFKYASGMLVIHAFTLAGGLEALQNRRSQAIDELRERERWASEKARLERLIGQKARMEAELAGVPSANAPPQLIEMTGKAEADALMKTENRKLALALKLHAAKLDSLQKIESDAARDMAILTDRNDQLKRLVTARTERVAELKAMSDRGFASKSLLLAANSEAVDAETRLQEGILSAAQATQKHAEAGRAVASYQLDRSVTLELDIAKLDEEIYIARAAVASLESVLNTMKSGVLPGQQISETLDYKIIRMGPDGTQYINADEMTALRPGDLIRVSIAVPVRDAAAPGPIPTPPLTK